MQLMIPAITMKAALAGFEAIGLDTERLLEPTGLTPDSLNGPFTSVPNDAFKQIWMAAFQQMPDPTLPTRAGFAVPFSEFGLLDHLVDTAESVSEGLYTLKLYFWLVATEMSLRFTHDDGDWIWIDTYPPEPTRFVAEQWTLALILQRFRRRVPAFAIEEVHLTQSVESNPALFEAHWGVPVRLGQRASGFRLVEGVWQMENRNADPALMQTLLSIAEQAEVKQFDEAPLVYAIRMRLPESLERGEFSAADIATELGISKRTLQRQLSAENITFKELLDLYRQEQAVLMLQNGTQDMAQIAYDLGYREQSSFNRAFKRWTGVSPSNWQKSARM